MACPYRIRHMPSAPPRNATGQELILTLFGDYLLDHDGPVWAGSLVSLLEPLGVSPVAARVGLSRMVRKGWLVVERRRARSHYGLTARGRQLLEEGSRRIYRPPHEERWSGEWYLIAYSIPEDRRRLRDRLRVRLQWLGCGMLGNGLWLSPRNIHAEIADLAARMRLTRHLQFFRAEHLGPSTVADLVAQAWDLRAVNADYAAFLARWRPHYERCRSCIAAFEQERRAVPPECLAPGTCFVRRFWLVHEYRSFPLADPFLPTELLPRNWKGHEAAELFHRYHDVLATPARRWVNAVVRAGATREPVTALERIRIA